MDFASFRKAVESRHDELSDRLKRVARHFLDEPNDMAFETVAVLASRSGVQPSTIVRFSQAFGFKGATQMQRLVRDGLLRSGAAAVPSASRPGGASDTAGSEQFPKSFAERIGRVTEAVSGLLHAIDENELDVASELLEAADTVFVAGFDAAFPVAARLSLLLAHLGRRVVQLDRSTGIHLQQGAALRAGDLLVAIGVAPHPSDLTAIVEAASAAGCPVVVLGAKRSSPIAKVSRVCFQPREAKVGSLSSIVASMCLVEILAAVLADRMEEDVRSPDE